MSIQVIGAGLGRAGTRSLKAALEQLGFARCYHPLKVFASMDQARTWDAAARGEPVDCRGFAVSAASRCPPLDLVLGRGDSGGVFVRFALA